MFNINLLSGNVYYLNERKQNKLTNKYHVFPMKTKNPKFNKSKVTS